MKSSHAIHMIGNAHIDIIWLWKWEEGFAEIRSTFASALDRIRENDDFIFTCACASYYKLVEESDPVLFERIKKAVAEGRWKIAGGWWLQPDCNAPSGESFVRQGLYAQNYFLEKFGKTALAAYNVDSFGHNGNLPQIFNKSGMKSYMFQRPGKTEKSIPSYRFVWEGIDGSKVDAFRIPHAYTNGGLWGPELADKIKWYQTDLINDEKIPLACFYGVGNHGGGPTVENLAVIDAARKEDSAVVYSFPEKYFNETQNLKDRPLVKGDLQFHAIGCYSAYSAVKRANNEAENALVFAEKMLSVLGGNETNKNRDALKSAWEKVLFNQFHDNLGGCSLPESYTKTFASYNWCVETVNQMTAVLLQNLASRIKTFEEGRTVIIWNPHPWETNECVEINGVCNAVYDIDGNAIPFELCATNAISSSYSSATRFNVKLPPLGWTSCKLINHKNRMEPHKLFGEFYKHTASNEFGRGSLRLVIDRAAGAIVSLFDTEKKIEYLSGAGIGFEIINDDSDTWSHAISSYRGIKRTMEVEYFTLVSEGTVTAEYEIVYRLFDSKVIMRVIVNGELHSVDFNIRVLWNEKHKLLKFRVGSAFVNDVFLSEIPYGFIERPADGREFPIQRWTSLCGKDGNESLCVLNDGVYSASAENGVLGLTLLRSPIFAHHEPMRQRPDLEPRYMEQGEHEFHFRLLPCREKEQSRQNTLRAAEFNQKPVYIVEGIHEGNLERIQSLCRVNKETGVFISTIKHAEKENGFIIRAVESAGKNTVAEIDFSWLGIKGTFTFSPFEIKTILVNGKKEIVETDLLERCAD